MECYGVKKASCLFMGLAEGQCWGVAFDAEDSIENEVGLSGHYLFN